MYGGLSWKPLSTARDAQTWCVAAAWANPSSGFGLVLVPKPWCLRGAHTPLELELPRLGVWLRLGLTQALGLAQSWFQSHGVCMAHTQPTFRSMYTANCTFVVIKYRGRFVVMIPWMTMGKITLVTELYSVIAFINSVYSLPCTLNLTSLDKFVCVSTNKWSGNLDQVWPILGVRVGP